MNHSLTILMTAGDARRQTQAGAGGLLTGTGNIFGMHTLHRLQNRTHAHARLDNSHNPQARVEAAERRAALEVIEREANAVQARVQSERDRESDFR